MPYGALLIVDDEPQNLAAMRQILSSKYRLLFARGGNEALAVARQQRPAMILLDIKMPDMDGYAVCRALKADPETEHIPVIFVSSLSDVGDEAEGFEAGCVDYIIKPPSPPIVLARINTHLSLVRAIRLEDSHRDAIFMLGAAGHYNDSDTGVHIWRMAAYAGLLARECGWSEEEAKQIEQAAPMHDTGKIGIPDAILRKPAKLDADEWRVMRTHSEIGHGILKNSKAPVFQMAAQIALYHHEKWDGSGYPNGLAGEDIPEAARIVALADVFDALSMKRPYKDPWPIDRIIDVMGEGSGLHFEPRLLEAFLGLMPQLLEIKQKWDSFEQRQNVA
ncbi:HD domain-containing phosphohydrolase [Magnetofaba australis]|nr:HD domain-containing phosphohydrolase [Magnetofaba australis]